jgi:hypothetical protein
MFSNVSNIFSGLLLGHVFLILIKKYFQYHIITNEDTINIILEEHCKNSSITIENDEPRGLFFGWYYIGYTKWDVKKDEMPELIFICTKKTYNKITQKIKESEDKNDTDNSCIVDHWDKREYYWGGCRYIKSEFNVSNLLKKLNQKQEEAIQKIKNAYILNNNKLICILHGKPGTGKSYTAFGLLKEMNGSYCCSYNPTKPADTLQLLHSKVHPKKNKPLIIVIEEIDCIFKEISGNGIRDKEYRPREVFNKESWNRLCDKIQWGLYPNTIIIGTMNENPENIRKLDQSYIRDDRVNVIFSMDEDFAEVVQEKIGTKCTSLFWNRYTCYD